MSKYIPHFGAFSLKTKSLKFYLTNSFVVHTVILLSTITTGKILLTFQDKLKSKNMELVQASVRVDMVSMPKYTLKELQQVSSGVEEAKKEEAPPEEKVDDKKALEEELKKVTEAKEAEELALIEAKKAQDKAEEAKAKKKNFQNMLKKLSEKKVDGTGETKAEKGMYGKEATALKNLALAGNKLSQGVSIYGTGNTEAMTSFHKYLARLPDIVRPEWKLPTFLLNKGLQCHVRVWLKPTGDLARAEIYKSSGDSEYDQRAIDAVKRTKFPKLSEEFEKRGSDGDILLGFPL